MIDGGQITNQNQIVVRVVVVMWLRCVTVGRFAFHLLLLHIIDIDRRPLGMRRAQYFLP